MIPNAIPCKRPKVTVTPRSPGDDRHDADCHVPGCSWTYPADKRFMALKSDANEQATRHRAEHRAAVPAHLLEPIDGGGYRASCQCGAIASETALTRTDAQAWLDHHLSAAHGLVVCS